MQIWIKPNAAMRKQELHVTREGEKTQKWEWSDGTNHDNQINRFKYKGFEGIM